MTLFRDTTQAARAAGLMAQLGLLGGFWMAGEAIVRVTGVPLPGGFAGFALLLALLGTGRLSLSRVKRGADWFVAQMLLFFLPAAVAIVGHGGLLLQSGAQILFVILPGTVAVMATTALVVELCLHRGARRVPEPQRAGPACP